jgi:hypothetical protein
VALAVLNAFDAMMDHLTYAEASAVQIACIDAWHNHAVEADALARAAGWDGQGDQQPTGNSLDHRAWREAAGEIIAAFQEQAGLANAVFYVRTMAASEARDAAAALAAAGDEAGALAAWALADVREAEAAAAANWSQMAAYCAQFGLDLIKIQDSTLGGTARAVADAGGPGAVGTRTEHHS